MAQLLAHTAIISANKHDIEIDGESDHSMELYADQNMLEQVIINLLKNALEAGAPVNLSWGEDNKSQWLKISDNGEGIKNSANLFVPFYSTKPTGSGIGLVLCQQILDKHNGTITLENRAEGGCLVSIHLAKIL